MEIYFGDIEDKNERIWEDLENFKEVSEALDATNESVITHRLNDLIRVLTMLSAIVLPLTFITGVYGMNIDFLPFSDDGVGSLLWVLVLMAFAAGCLIWWFRKKRWL
jgi:magnesium transporter